MYLKKYYYNLKHNGHGKLILCVKGADKHN